MTFLKNLSQMELFVKKRPRQARDRAGTSSFIPPARELGIRRTSEDKQDKIYKQLIKGIQRFFETNAFSRAVIGLSGGVDSSLALKLTVDALGSDKTTGIIMPELALSAKINIDHAKKLAEFFQIEYFYQTINPFMMDFYNLAWKPSTLASMNTKARVRMSLLYNFANTYNALVIGTSNKSELLLGYGTKHGDLAADVEVLGDLFKTEVFALSRYVGLPEEIINKAPTAELASGQTDEGELGASYKELDEVLAFAKEGPEKAMEKGLNVPLVHKVFSLMKKSEHKRRMPMVIKARL